MPSIRTEMDGSGMEIKCLLASLVIVNLVVLFASVGKASPTKYPVRFQINVKVPMRDGVNLSAKICRPNAYTQVKPELVLVPSTRLIGWAW